MSNTYPKIKYFNSQQENDSIQKYGSNIEAFLTPNLYPFARLDIQTYCFDNYTGPEPDFITNFKHNEVFSVDIHHVHEKSKDATHPCKNDKGPSTLKVCYKWSNNDHPLGLYVSTINNTIRDCLSFQFKLLELTNNSIVCESIHEPLSPFEEFYQYLSTKELLEDLNVVRRHPAFKNTETYKMLSCEHHNEKYINSLTKITATKSKCDELKEQNKYYKEIQRIKKQIHEDGLDQKE